MNILFVYYDVLESPYGKYHEGIALLSAVLKQAGHEVNLMHITESREVEQVVADYKAFHSDTDMVACSITQLSLDFYQQFCSELKKEFDVFTVCGGPIVTLCAESVIESGSFDAVCRGDGEKSLAELCSRFDSGFASYSDIEGFWFYNDGNVIKNPVREISREISDNPIPDRTIFDLNRLINYRVGTMPVMAARGCPFNCSFCCNHALKNAFPNRKDYIRYKTVEQLIKEIKDEIGRCKELGLEIDNIRFYDDLLITNKKWFAQFAAAYIDNINMPYSCNCRFELLDDEILKALKDSGCNCIQMGLETGDEDLRRDVLNRRQPNSMILDKARLCHKYGIRFHTYTMVGIPQEDIGKSLQTVKFAARIGASSCQVSVFYPFLATKLYDVCKENGYLQDEKVDSYMGGHSILKLPTMSELQISHAHDNFHPFYQLYCRLYKMPAVLRIIPEKILDLLWFNYPLSWPVRVLYKIARKYK